MEKKEEIKNILSVFSHLMRQTINPTFKIINPEGGVAIRTLTACIESLERTYGDNISKDRMVDFCICQVYAISRYDKGIITKWGISQFFGKKAVERYVKNKKQHKYYEDQWLSNNNLSRASLLSLIETRKEHPQFKFIYPQYEDQTKARLLNTDIGFYICGCSTLLWTPFSPVCRKCTKTGVCKQRTKTTYPELYRIRMEEFNKNEGK